MLAVSSSGQSGPDRHFAGYAPLFGAWGGLGEMTGYADGPPIEMRHVMDHTVGMNSAVAVMAALCFAVLGMFWTFWSLDGWAAILILPYILWLALAAPLNWRVWRDNPGAGS